MAKVYGIFLDRWASDEIIELVAVSTSQERIEEIRKMFPDERFHQDEITLDAPSVAIKDAVDFTIDTYCNIKYNEKILKAPSK